MIDRTPKINLVLCSKASANGREVSANRADRSRTSGKRASLLARYPCDALIYSKITKDGRPFLLLRKATIISFVAMPCMRLPSTLANKWRELGIKKIIVGKSSNLSGDKTQNLSPDRRFSISPNREALRPYG